MPNSISDSELIKVLREKSCGYRDIAADRIELLSAERDTALEKCRAMYTRFMPGFNAEDIN